MLLVQACSLSKILKAISIHGQNFHLTDHQRRTPETKSQSKNNINLNG